MRTHALLLLGLFATPAFAHILLEAPANFQVVDAYGSPNKAEPCGGAGTATNAVTTVTAGDQLTVTWTEPILHPGHFRIGIAANPADFVTPTPVLSNGGSNCQSAPIDANPSAPILVDGLYPHTTAAPNNRWTTTVTVPNTPCENCTLQLMQFMSAHAPPCFYYQCAKLRIVARDAGTLAMDAGVDAGLGPVDAGVDAGVSALDAGQEADAGVHDHGHTPDPATGCGCTSAPAGALALLLLGSLARRRSWSASSRG